MNAGSLEWGEGAFFERGKEGKLVRLWVSVPIKGRGLSEKKKREESLRPQVIKG